MFKEETLKEQQRQDGTYYEEPDGNVIEVLSDDYNSITVLTKVDNDNGGETPRIDPEAWTVSGLETVLEDIDVDNDTIHTVIDAEKRTQNRTTAINVLEEALSE